MPDNRVKNLEDRQTHAAGLSQAVERRSGLGSSRARGGEFFAVVASLLMLVIVPIATTLPLLPEVRQTFDLDHDATALGAVVTFYFLGVATGMIPSGILSDRYGRRPIVWTGLALYAVGAVGSGLAPHLIWFLGSYFVWGLGAAGAQTPAVSMLRDTRQGKGMARSMSFMMGVIGFFPVFAPLLVAAFLSIASWRLVPLVSAATALGVAIWAIRLPETRPHDHILSLRWREIRRVTKLVLTTRTTIGYTIGLVFLAAAFNAYLSGVELALVDAYKLRDHYALILSLLMIFPAVAGIANGAVVERIGLTRMVRGILVVYLTAATIGTIGSIITRGAPGFGLFIAVVLPALTCHGTVQANFNSIALVPMGGNAGTAAAIVGALATAGGVTGGFVASQFYNGTTVPLIVTFFLCGAIAWLATFWAQQDRSLSGLLELSRLDQGR